MRARGPGRWGWRCGRGVGVALLVGVLGCATTVTGTSIERVEAGLRHVVRGRTTRSDVVRVFGRPSQTMVNNSGEVLVYRVPAAAGDALAEAGEASAIRVLMIFLDGDRRVVDYVFTRPRERAGTSQGS